MGSLIQDVRYGFRMLWRSPGFTFVAVLTLALGIGANTAIFSVIDATFLQPLEFFKPDQLVDIDAASQQRELTEAGVTVPEYLEWKRNATSMQDMAIYTFSAFAFTQSTGARRVEGWQVSPEFFGILEEKPLLGRFFVAGEDQPGKDDVIVVREKFWRTQLGGDPTVIGRTLRINSKPMTVIGVMPQGSIFPGSGFDMFQPLSLTNDMRADHNDRSYNIVGRLKDGISLSQARADLATISRNMERAYPATDAGWTVDMDTLLERVVVGSRSSVYILMAAVMFLLLIACLNIGSLLTARMTGRTKEVALRTALGAARGRLLRQFVTEGILLSLLGGIGGILVSFPVLKLLIARLPQASTRVSSIRVDSAVLIFTLALCAAVGIIFGVLPASGAHRVSLAMVLKGVSGATTAGSTRMKLQNALVVAQLAISLVLLSGAGLLIRSFFALRNTDPGFSAGGVLVSTQLVLPTDKYTNNTQCLSFFTQLVDRIRTLPGVEAVGGITSLPLANNSVFRGYEITGRPAASSGGELTAVRNVVTEGYFRTMGIPLRKGRLLNENDNESAPRVALINEALANREFKNLDPLGQDIVLHGADSKAYEIVGVVGSSRQFFLNQDPSPEVFTPYRQSTIQYMYIVTKTRGNPFDLSGPIRSAVRDIDRDQPVGHGTLEDWFRDLLIGPRFYATLITVFAGLALVLAAVGIYGVLSYLVAQRTREIGIRMALGATRRDIWNHVIVRGLILAAIGLGAGVLFSLAMTRAIKTVLYHVSASDRWSFAGASGVLVLMAVLACAVPAYRAMKVDPMIALRYE